MHHDDLTATIVEGLAGDMPIDLTTIPTNNLINAGQTISNARQEHRTAIGRLAAELRRRDDLSWRAIADLWGMSYSTVRRLALPHLATEAS